MRLPLPEIKAMGIDLVWLMPIYVIGEENRKGSLGSYYSIKDYKAGEFIPPVEDWTDVISLDYSNPGLRRAMIDAMAYWVREFGVDGFRCDVAEEVPVDFWNEARRALNNVGQVFMLAEGQLPEFHDEAFERSHRLASRSCA